MGQKGHGTILAGADAQGDARAWVTNNGGEESYEYDCERDIINSSGETIEPGQVVFLEVQGSSLIAVSLGGRAKGNVSSDGQSFTVTDAGQTDLSGTIEISSSHGNNDGFGGATDVTASNINGQAAYLE